MIAHVRPPRLSLAGLRILIPRGGDLGAALHEKVLDRGGSPRIARLLETAPPSDPAAFTTAIERWNLGEYDWLVVTSATTAAALAAAGAQPHAKTAAVGPVTAAAIQALGFRLHVMPGRDFSGHGLAQSLLAALPDLTVAENKPARVLLPVSELADVTVEQALRAAGHVVHRVAAYTTVTTPEIAGLRASVAAGEFDVVLATSSSAARAIADRLTPLPATTRVAAIGEPTARTLASCGLATDIVAEISTTDGLLDAVSIALIAGARETYEHTRQGETR
ncbi:uroporphyrinogen-III synthase [Leucobacter sp. HY1910]